MRLKLGHNLIFDMDSVEDIEFIKLNKYDSTILDIFNIGSSYHNENINYSLLLKIIMEKIFDGNISEFIEFILNNIIDNFGNGSNIRYNYKVVKSYTSLIPIKKFILKRGPENLHEIVNKHNRLSVVIRKYREHYKFKNHLRNSFFSENIDNDPLQNYIQFLYDIGYNFKVEPELIKLFSFIERIDLLTNIHEQSELDLKKQHNKKVVLCYKNSSTYNLIKLYIDNDADISEEISKFMIDAPYKFHELVADKLTFSDDIVNRIIRSKDNKSIDSKTCPKILKIYEKKGFDITNIDKLMIESNGYGYLKYIDKKYKGEIVYRDELAYEYLYYRIILNDRGYPHSYMSRNIEKIIDTLKFLFDKGCSKNNLLELTNNADIREVIINY